MPVKQLLMVTDDFDGSELDADTDPIVLRVGDQAWRLYLSDKSRAALDNAVKAFTGGAEVVSTFIPEPSTAPRRGRPAGATTATAKVDYTDGLNGLQRKDAANLQKEEIKEYAKKNKLPDVGDRGRILQSTLDAYYAANKDVRHHYFGKTAGSHNA